MSLTYTCDLCGAMIDRETAYVTLNGNGDRAKDFWRSGYVGHYHADPEIGWGLRSDLEARPAAHNITREQKKQIKNLSLSAISRLQL